MKKRLNNILIISGVSLLCIAPRNVHAEEGVAQRVARSSGIPLITNLIVAEVSPTKPVVVPEPQVLPQTTETPVSANYRNLVNYISTNNNVDPDLIFAMMKTESNYDRRAVSPKGARGLMQLMPETGRRFGVQDFFDPRQNIEGGVRYMKYLLDMFDNRIDLALAAYNAGENLVVRVGGIPPITETRNYVKRILADYKKPSTVAVASQAKSEPKAVVANPQPDAAIADRVQESAPILSWMDARGVTHISNLGPPN